MEMSLEAILALQAILNVSVFDQSSDRVVQPSLSFIDCLFSSAVPTISPIMSYARALQKLGTYIFRDGSPEEARDLTLLAIAIHRRIVSTDGTHQHKMYLTRALLSLLQQRTANLMHSDALIAIGNECVELLSELVETNPVSYTRELVFVLWEKGSLLEDLSRDAEAIATWEEAARLAEQLVEDSKLYATTLAYLSDQFRRLKRHEDAVRTRTLAITTYQEQLDDQALEYILLSADLQDLGRYKESAEAVCKSVGLYRRLTMKDPDRWTNDLVGSLSKLAHLLAALGNYSEALITWNDAMSTLDNFLNANKHSSSCVSNTCLNTLDRHTLISNILEDTEQCLNVSSSTVQHLHLLRQIYPQDSKIFTHLLWAEFCYANNMLRVSHLQDAQQYIALWSDIWKSKQAPIPEYEVALWHALMVTLEVDTLHAVGSTMQALLATKKVHDIVAPTVSIYQPCFSAMICSMVYEARIQADLGNNQRALQVAEKALQLSRANTLEPIVDSLAWSLYGLAFSALSCQNYESAVEAAQEGCNVLASPKYLKDWQNSRWWEQRAFMRPSLLALLSAAEANLGRYSTAL